MIRLLYDSIIIISGTAPHPPAHIGRPYRLRIISGTAPHPPAHIGRPYRLRIIICGTSGATSATSGATSAANYMVILTPPAASAGRDSIEDFGLGGAGGAIVTGA